MSPGLRVRVRGLVQGVGYRPTVWREATALGLSGEVLNDGDGVLIRAFGDAEALDTFVRRLSEAAPPLARVDAVEATALEPDQPPRAGFVIAESVASAPATAIVPDAATCPKCRADVFDPLGRRFRYAFTNCTECGPRFSIVSRIPYDRPNTTMGTFALCEACRAEYEDPADRRFHAQPNACFACGPRAWLERMGGKPFERHALTHLDDIDAAATLLQRGHIVAIKGLGGFHLACDATNEEAVARLRRQKGRPTKALAMMVRDLAVLRRYAAPSPPEIALLESAAAPIVLVAREPIAAAPPIAPSVAPGVGTWGFMLPYTPLHLMLFMRLERPMVMTSGNHSEAPQLIDDDEVRARLSDVAEYVLTHDRPIANRIDDSVVRVLGDGVVTLRRARGYAPSPLPLPPGFEGAPPVLAYGGELKVTFCRLDRRGAMLSQHMGDLENADTYVDYQKNLTLYGEIFRHRPERLAADLHPDYLSSRLAVDRARREGLPLERIQHHHAHLAACLFEHRVPLDHPPVLGLILDGLGLGPDGALWGGEALLGGYQGFTHVGTLEPVALLGGERAMKEPWRNTLAHLVAALGWERYRIEFTALELTRFFETKPLQALLTVLERGGALAPLASSAGRLFDAVAAAVGICRERQSAEGEAAMALEATCDRTILGSDREVHGYPFAIQRSSGRGLSTIEPAPMWRALLGDLVAATPRPRMASRFHNGLARALVRLSGEVAWTEGHRVGTVVLSGGVFQNAVLRELVTTGLRRAGFDVLNHHQVPPNDGGIALGQAAIAVGRAARPRSAP